MAGGPRQRATPPSCRGWCSRCCRWCSALPGPCRGGCSWSCYWPWRYIQKQGLPVLSSNTQVPRQDKPFWTESRIVETVDWNNLVFFLTVEFMWNNISPFQIIDVLHMKMGRRVKVRGTKKEIRLDKGCQKFNQYYQYQLFQKLLRMHKEHMVTSKIQRKKPLKIPSK